MVSKDEWEIILNNYKHRCAICGKTEKQVGILVKAHLKARSKGGSQVIPMCANHHTMFDQGKLTKAQLKKIGVDPEKYNRIKPSRGSQKQVDPVKAFWNRKY